MGIGEFLPDSLLIDCLASLFCNEGEITQGLCTNILFILCGFDEAQVAFISNKPKYFRLRLYYKVRYESLKNP